MNVMSKLDRAGLDLTEIGLRLREIAQDGITAEELREIEVLADDLLDKAVVVEDVALDMECARQVLRLGRDRVPNRELARKIYDFEQSVARRKLPLDAA